MALLLAFVQAPFLHFHADEENEHHAGHFLHTHFAHVEKASNKPVVRADDPDEDAHDIDWFSVVVDHFVLHQAPPEEIVVLVPQATEEAFYPEEFKSGHDPPKLTRCSPRSPPQA